MCIDSNPPIGVSRPLTVQNHNPAPLRRLVDSINAHTSNAFGQEFCTDHKMHLEKALLWFSGSPFLVNFRKMKLKFGEGKGTSLIDQILVFLR